MKKTLDIKKLILLNMPYILLGLFATNFGEAWRMLSLATTTRVPAARQRRAALIVLMRRLRNRLSDPPSVDRHLGNRHISFVIPTTSAL